MKFMRKNGGFTLVELIVVIAILAILAGVAVPAYSGYINKANEAADNQLLSAINTAFAAACIENGVAPASVTNASIQVSGKKIGAVTGVNAPAGNTAGVPTSFADYFGKANPNATFKVYETLVYNAETHNFEGAAAIKKAFGGGFVTLNAGDLNNLTNSVFGKDITGTLELVDDVSTLVAGFAGNTNALNTALSNEDYLNSVLLAAGVPADRIAGMDAAQKQAAVNDVNDTLAKSMVAAGKATDMETALNQVKGNALVLYAAQQTGKMDKNNMKDFLSNADSDTVGTIVGNMMTDGKSGEGVAQAALICGMYASYVKNDPNYDPNNEKYAVNIETVLKALEDESAGGFKEYLADSKNYEADLDGYVSAMNMANSSTQDPDAVQHLMINGFAGSGLDGIISDALIGN